MKKTVTRILLAVLAVILVGGGAAWWVTASETKQSVVDMIARINAHKAADGSHVEIRYQSVEATGFPPSITIRLVDPSATVTIPNAAFATPGQAAAAGDTVFTWAYKGYADVVTNHLGASYGLVLSGDDTYVLSDGTTSHTINGTDSTYRFAVKAKSLEQFLAWEQMDLSKPADVEKFIDSLREFSADVGALSYKDAVSGEPAFSHDQGKLSFVNRSDAKAFDFDIAILAKNSEIHPAYSKVLQKIGSASSLNAALFGADDMPFSVAKAGKQNIDISLSGYIARSKEKGSRKLRITAPRFSVSNNYYDIHAPLDLDITESPERMDFKAKLDAKLNVTAAGAADAHRSLNALYAMLPLAAAGNPSFNETAFREKIASALPTVSTLGPITFALDIDGALNPRGTTTAGKGHINVTQLELSHARWGLKLDGKVDNTGELPDIALNLNCLKCDAMTADTMQSAADAQLAFAMLEPGRPLYPLGDEMREAINGLFAQVGKKDAASGDVLFAITTPAANDIRIGDQPLAGVMMQALTTLTPFLTPQVPGKAVEGVIEGATEAPAAAPAR